MFVFESTLNRRVDERYNGIIYITINSKIAMIYLGMGIDESKKEEKKRNATRALPNQDSSKDRSRCPSAKLFDTSGEKSSKIFSLTSLYNETPSLGTTFPRLYLEPIRTRLTSLLLTVGRNKKTKKEEGDCKEDHRDD